MGFRERPEYQDWREAVFRLFGQKCIRCGHAGNIHAHHVMPVEDYPELVFQPMNGVPLCGNCHVEIKGDELAHVDDLQRLQRAILGDEAVGVASNAPSESELREHAYAEPSNAEAVLAWFHVADYQAVTDFYDRHQEDSTTTAALCEWVALPLLKRGRWKDAIAVADKGMEISEHTGTLEQCAWWIGSAKSEALCELGRLPEAVAFLRELTARFPEDAWLRCKLSVYLRLAFWRAHEGGDALNESVRQALKAVEFAPDNFSFVSHAFSVLRTTCEFAAALRYGKRALSLASTDEEKIETLESIAGVYGNSDLYADARSYLRQALEIDDCNVDVITDIAFSFLDEGNEREAVRMAKRGLLLDPQNKWCQDICKRLGCRGFAD
jgi:tetratricopeptide (TPR) repeat protein